MSQSAPYVRCDDGLWYQNPVWYDIYSGHKWYICFDDDDPPEIVIARAVGADETERLAREILTGFGRRYKLIRKGNTSGKCSRCFPHHDWDFKKMDTASSWFFDFEEAPPKPRRPPIHIAESKIDGVLYPYGGPMPRGNR